MLGRDEARDTRGAVVEEDSRGIDACDDGRPVPTWESDGEKV